MANGTTPYWKVSSPPLIPTRFGLYAAATPINEPHGPWEYGTVWDDSDNCSQGGLWQPCCSEFEGTPSVACRQVGLTVEITARPAVGGGTEILVVAGDDWTGPATGLTVTVGALAPLAIDSDGTTTSAGTIPAPCGGTYAVTVATDVPSSGDSGNLVVDANCNGKATFLVQVCLPEPTTEKAFSTSTFVYGDPFVVYDGRSCPDKTEEEMRNSALQRLAVSEQRQVEQQLWRGPTRPHFSPNPDVVVLNGGTAVSPAMGIALLEGYLADHYLGVGYIHTPRYTAGLLSREYQIAYDLSTGPTLQTSIGTNYVFGSGYPTTGPDGSLAPAGHAWAYVTGQIVIRRSPIVVNAVRDSKTGCVTALAERTVVIGIQCGFVAAALIDYGRCDCCEPTPPALMARRAN